MYPLLLLLVCAFLSSAQERYYVAESGESKVAVVDGATRRVTGEIPVSTAPQAVALSIDGRRLFVASEGKNAVDVVDRVTAKLVRSIPVGRQPDGLLLAPEGRKLFVAARGAAQIDVIDTATLDKEKTIFTGKEPGGLAVTPDKTRMLVAVEGDHKLQVINIRTESIEFDIPVNGAPVAVAFESDKSLVIHRLFVLLTTGDIEVVDWAQRKPGGKVAGPARGVATSPDWRTLWTTGADAVEVYSLPGVKRMATVPVGKGAGFIVFTPDGKRALATSETEGSLSVIDAAMYRELARIPVGKGPRGIAVAE
jgi:YVTN family beta-propeller protein